MSEISVRKRSVAGLLVALFVLAGCRGVYGLTSEYVQLHVEQYYTVNGLIYNFKQAANPEVLSESIGLYMQYLVVAHDAARFAAQVQILEEHFIVREHGYTFVRWKLGDHITVSAVIDDLRLAKALTVAADRFNEPSYHALAVEIIESIQANMLIDGRLRDFYDWHYRLAYGEFFLSYFIVPVMTHFGFPDAVFEPLEGLVGTPFFLERYVDGAVLPANPVEVNMIDQTLIAIAFYKRVGHVEPHFQRFLEERLMEDGVIFARYYRDTGRNVNENESSATYAFLLHYFRVTGQPELAQKAEGLLLQMQTGDAVTAHFFDFINKELALVGGLCLFWEG